MKFPLPIDKGVSIPCCLLSKKVSRVTKAFSIKSQFAKLFQSNNNNYNNNNYAESFSIRTWKKLKDDTRVVRNLICNNNNNSNNNSNNRRNSFGKVSRNKDVAITKKFWRSHSWVFSFYQLSFQIHFLENIIKKSKLCFFLIFRSLAVKLVCLWQKKKCICCEMA